MYVTHDQDTLQVQHLVDSVCACISLKLMQHLEKVASLKVILVNN